MVGIQAILLVRLQMTSSSVFSYHSSTSLNNSIPPFVSQAVFTIPICSIILHISKAEIPSNLIIYF